MGCETEVSGVLSRKGSYPVAEEGTIGVEKPLEGLPGGALPGVYFFPLPRGRGYWRKQSSHFLGIEQKGRFHFISIGNTPMLLYLNFGDWWLINQFSLFEYGTSSLIKYKGPLWGN